MKMGESHTGLPGVECRLGLPSGLQTGSQFEGEDPARSHHIPASRLSISQKLRELGVCTTPDRH